MAGPLKRFVDSLRGLFSDPEDDDPLNRMTDIEPEGVEDSTDPDENMHPPVAGWEMEQDVEA